MDSRRKYKLQYLPMDPNSPYQSIDWMGKRYLKASDYYREVVMTMPYENGEMLGAQEHIDALSRLTLHGLYITPEDTGKDIYVDDWYINGSYVCHKHPEFGIIVGPWTSGIIEAFTSADGSCEICRKHMPGEIEMMRNFYLLDGV